MVIPEPLKKGGNYKGQGDHSNMLWPTLVSLPHSPNYDDNDSRQKANKSRVLAITLHVRTLSTTTRKTSAKHA